MSRNSLLDSLRRSDFVQDVLSSRVLLPVRSAGRSQCCATMTCHLEPVGADSVPAPRIRVGGSAAMKYFILGLLFSLLLPLAGCATSIPVQTAPVPMRLDELVAMSKAGASDDKVIAQLAQRGAAFVLSPQDVSAQREAGVSDGVLRYLQGRAEAEQALAARIQRGRYWVPSYAGASYFGYPYLGYYAGLHYYGGASVYVIGSRHGGHGGFHHRGGHRGGRH